MQSAFHFFFFCGLAAGPRAAPANPDDRRWSTKPKASSSNHEIEFAHRYNIRSISPEGITDLITTLI